MPLAAAGRGSARPTLPDTSLRSSSLACAVGGSGSDLAPFWAVRVADPERAAVEVPAGPGVVLVEVPCGLGVGSVDRVWPAAGPEEATAGVLDAPDPQPVTAIARPHTTATRAGAPKLTKFLPNYP